MLHRRLNCFGSSGGFCDCRIGPRAARWPFVGGKASFGRLVGDGRLRLSHRFFDDIVITMGERMATLIAIESGGEATNEYALSYSSSMPAIIARKDFYVLLAKMMLSICSMLHDG